MDREERSQENKGKDELEGEEGGQNRERLWVEGVKGRKTMWIMSRGGEEKGRKQK